MILLLRRNSPLQTGSNRWPNGFEIIETGKCLFNTVCICVIELMYVIPARGPSGAIIFSFAQPSMKDPSKW